MIVFYILLLVPMLIQHVMVGSRKIDYKKKNNISLFAFFLILLLLVMLRHESVGSDTRNYANIFEKISRMSWEDLGKESLEVGFLYFNKAISLISKEPQFFFAVTAVVVIAMIYPTYRRLCEDPSLTIAIFCIMSTFVMMFSGIRQMIAIGIGFIAYEFTRKRKLIPFIVCVILAMIFHTSAFMLVFMYPLYHVKITKKWLIAVIPIMTLIFVFNKQIFTSIAVILERYTKYDASMAETGAYTIIILFAFFSIFAFLIPEESKMDKETIGLRNFLLLSLVLQMFAPLHTIAMRMNYYYIIFIPLLIPKIIECRSKSWEQVAIVGRHVMVIFFLVYFFISASDGGGLDVFPYHFFWENI